MGPVRHCWGVILASCMQFVFGKTSLALVPVFNLFFCKAFVWVVMVTCVVIYQGEISTV